MKLCKSVVGSGKAAKYIISILMLSATLYARADTITIGVADGNFEALGVKNGMFVGSLSEIYQCTIDNSGLNYNIRVFPHARILYKLKRGEIDLGLPLVKMSNRDEFAVFASPMLDAPFLLYSSEQLADSGDLSDYTFVIRRSTASKDLIVARNAQYEEVSSWRQALLLAKVKRYDGAVIPAVIARSFDDEDFDGLYESNFGSIPVSIYVSQQIDNTEKLLESLNLAIKGCVP